MKDKKEQARTKKEDITRKVSSPQENEGNQTSREYDKLAAEDEKTRTRKPGSQSNSADTHNNGRGGGK